MPPKKQCVSEKKKVVSENDKQLKTLLQTAKRTHDLCIEMSYKQAPDGNVVLFNANDATSFVVPNGYGLVHHGTVIAVKCHYTVVIKDDEDAKGSVYSVPLEFVKGVVVIEDDETVEKSSVSNDSATSSEANQGEAKKDS